MADEQKTNGYPHRPPKRFPEKSLHGRARTGNLLYNDMERAQKFYVNVFGWDMFKLPPNVLGRCPAPETPDVCCATGPAQFGWEGAVPGYMPMELVHRNELDNKPYLMLEVDMRVSLESTLERFTKAGGKVLRVGGDRGGDWAEVALVEDPAGNRLLLWKCPDSRTWEEPETDYDKD